jgi:hypothetical protein
MDEELKQMMEKLRQQQEAGGFQVTETPSIDEQAIMEPPRPDYSEAVAQQKPQYSKIAEHIKNLNTNIAVDPNYKQPIPTREVYPSEEKLNAQQEAMKAITGSVHGKDFNSIKQIENLRKVLGSK